MIKLKLKRRMSGNKIRTAKRKAEFDPYKTYENKGLYRKNRVKKRHVENPNVYEGEKGISCAYRNIRIPKKHRKNAWKRFKKSFPNISMGRGGRMKVKIKKVENEKAKS